MTRIQLANEGNKELIKVTVNENNQKIVSAKELHKGLQIKSNFTTWFSRMCEYGFEENIDFVTVWSDSKNGNAVEYLGSPQKMSALGYEKDYAIVLDMAKEISMIQRNELGKKFRKYFIECEKQLQEMKPQFKLPTTYKEALIELVATIEEKEKIEAEKERLIHSAKTYTATELAKELGFKSAQAFNEELKERKIQYKINNTWVLCARYSDKGYQNIKQIELDNGRIIYDRKFTGVGRDWIVNEVFKDR